MGEELSVVIILVSAVVTSSPVVVKCTLVVRSSVFGSADDVVSSLVTVENVKVVLLGVVIS